MSLYVYSRSAETKDGKKIFSTDGNRGDTLLEQGKRTEYSCLAPR